MHAGDFRAWARGKGGKLWIEGWGRPAPDHLNKGVECECRLSIKTQLIDDVHAAVGCATPSTPLLT